MAQVEFIAFPDGDIEGNEGMESIVIDSVEMERFERAHPPTWVTALRLLFIRRDEVAAAATA